MFARLTSPPSKARLAGLLYALIFIVAPSGSATATAVNVTVTLACDVGIALLLYDLLRPVSRSLTLLAAFFRLLYVVFMAVNSLQFFGLANLVRNSRSAETFDLGYGISLVPFGVHCILLGYLIFKSTFVPRILGILVAAAGFGYLTFIWPPLGDRLFFPYLVTLAVLGEGSLTLWLLVMGVNAQRWREQASGGDPTKLVAPVTT